MPSISTEFNQTGLGKKAVVLLSGGLDSTTCLAYALAQGFECHALSFYYGQRHSAELDAARKIAAQAKISHTVIELPIAHTSCSALIDQTQPIPEHRSAKSANAIPTTYVPARNTIFLSFALSLAEQLTATAIFIGISAVDYSGYPDCRPEYLAAFQALANLATKAGVEGQLINIHAPLIHLSKSETIQLGLSLGVEYGLTVSCYQSTADGMACGVCDSCVLRQQGFALAGISDPTRYQPH